MYSRDSNGARGDKRGNIWEEVIVKERRKYKPEKEIACKGIKAACQKNENDNGKRKNVVFICELKVACTP